MLKRLLRKVSMLKKNSSRNTSSLSFDTKERSSKDLRKNLRKIADIFGSSDDITIREFSIGMNNDINAAVVFIDGLVEKRTINENIIKPLMLYPRDQKLGSLTHNVDILDVLNRNILTVAKSEKVSTIEEITDTILSGDTALLVDGYSSAFRVFTKGWEARGVEEPKTESVVRGPREGFSETLRTNTALLRRKIKNPNLTFEVLKIGRVTRTDICIAYIRGIADEKLVKELKTRIGRIDIDGILESGYIEAFIEDAPFSIFPTVGNTEKPDVAAAKMLEGRVAVLTDGTPIVLTIPYIFVELLQSSEDYYSRPWYSTFIRWIRIGALLATTLLPALYVAAVAYHHEMIPTVLLITIAAAKEGIPFPVFVETLLMAIMFEMLREAGIRLPRPVGQAVSIVGALVIGEAAVQAGIVSAPAVIVIAASGISSFTIPSQADSITIMRFFLLILSGLAGLFGILFGIILLVAHLASLRSFGAPYFSPIAPTVGTGLKDVIIRAPLWAMKKRPRISRSDNGVRLGTEGIPQSPGKHKRK